MIEYRSNSRAPSQHLPSVLHYRYNFSTIRSSLRASSVQPGHHCNVCGHSFRASSNSKLPSYTAEPLLRHSLTISTLTISGLLLADWSLSERLLEAFNNHLRLHLSSIENLLQYLIDTAAGHLTLQLKITVIVPSCYQARPTRTLPLCVIHRN